MDVYKNADGQVKGDHYTISLFQTKGRIEGQAGLAQGVHRAGGTIIKMAWEDCVEEIDKTVLIAAKERGYLTDIEERHIIAMSRRAVIEAQKDQIMEEYQ